MNKIIMVRRKNQKLWNAIAIVTGAFLSQSLSALPQAENFTAVNGDSVYSTSGTQGTLDISQDRRVVEFGGAGVGSGFNVGNGETVNFTQTGGNSSWSVLVRDVNTSGNVSNIDGMLSGDVRVFFVNQNGIIFGQNAQIDLASLVASTLGISDSDFSDGIYRFNAGESAAEILVHGLRSVRSRAQITLISSHIEVDGNVDISEGDFNLIAGQEVIVAFNDNNIMQFDITEALQTRRNERVIEVTANGDVTAANVTMKAEVTDPRSYAVNNSGVVRAKGIDTSTPGVIRLVGTGGRVESTGTLDISSENGDGAIYAQAGNRVRLSGSIEGGEGTLNVIIGDGTSSGTFQIDEGTDVTLATITVEGIGQGNTIRGLGNYRVSGLNSGTASYIGVGGGDGWTNTGAIQFSNVADLFATSETANTLEILTGGELLEEVLLGNGDGAQTLARFGSINGGTSNDTFIIAGSVQDANGLGGDDTFVIEGGRVEGVLDGGDDFDTLTNAINPVRTNADGTSNPEGISGFSDNVNSWVNIQVVNELVVPPLIEVPDPSPPATGSFLVPVVAPVNISGLANVSLGLVSDGNNVRLPCGQNVNMEFAEPSEEDCFNQYGGPEFQQLMSSLIHFNTDSVAITAASANRLDRIADFVVESDMFNRVVVSGHTDSDGSVAHNEKLSLRRAEAAGNRLLEQGVGQELVETHSYGESLPARPNDSVANRAYNRRVQVELKR